MESDAIEEKLEESIAVRDAFCHYGRKKEMAKKNNKRQKKKNGASVQELLGIKAFTEYGIQTNRGELLFFRVTPTNISVLSPSSVETKIRQLTLVLSAVPDVEISCTDSAECFDENKAYLMERAEEGPAIFICGAVQEYESAAGIRASQPNSKGDFRAGVRRAAHGEERNQAAIGALLRCEYVRRADAR